jgi:hypothetical protein
MNRRAQKPLSLALALSLLALALAAPAQAEEVKRYKPVVVQSGDNNLYPPKVLIVDTRDGHLWLWQERGKRDAQEGAGETQLIYQGRVVPGRAAGDVISVTKSRK